MCDPVKQNGTYNLNGLFLGSRISTVNKKRFGFLFL